MSDASPASDQQPGPHPVNKGGAPLGNTNRLKHGKKSKICRGGKLRDGERHVENVRNKWVRRIEAATIEKHGSLSITHQMMIEAIGDFLVQKMTLQRRYRVEKKIELRDQILLMETIQKSNQQALQLIGKLGIEMPTDGDSSDDDDWPV